MIEGEDFNLEEFLESSTTSTSSTNESTSDEENANGQARARVQHFIETIHQYTETEFKNHFRLRRNTTNNLVDMYTHFCTEQEQPRNGGRAKLEAEKKIFIFLWYMANTITFRQLSNLFDCSQSSAWRVVAHVSSWLTSIGHEFISWPNLDQVPKTTERFERRKGIDHIIGAIDCTHIKIKGPRVNKADYFDRNRNYSLIIQAICDADMKFLDVYVGEPGSLHDSRVFRRSAFYNKVIKFGI